ncbi:MAG: UDP-3-O-(3-hydroxymyristoyl)glucosamine N-acyltransferase [Armatimonadetes bacterium]|nr:UDP-3-O-(3-hydroxymyristoyl)glucosamine N-acyltransferase [Armatimonadota bacterium]
MTILSVAEHIGAAVEGDPSVEITGVASIEEAIPGDLVFAETERLFRAAEESQATAIIAPVGLGVSRKPVLRVHRPRYAFARALELFAPEQSVKVGVHPTAVLGESARLGHSVAIQPYCVIGKNVRIGNRVVIYPFVYIGNDVTIGDDTIIYPNTAIHDRTEIGHRVVINSGCVIGADGFGFLIHEGRHYKIPQIGNVSIGDDVEIGANATIDRARTGTTRIHRGTKIDNLVQIAHNVEIGEDCIIVAQVGISGSVEVGDRVILAGQAGIKDNIAIGSDSMVGAQAGVIGDVPPNSVVSGYPARPHKDQMRVHASLHRLPEIVKTFPEIAVAIQRLTERIEELEQRLDGSGQ